MLNNTAQKFVNNDKNADKLLDYASQEIENKLRVERIFKGNTSEGTVGFGLEQAKYNTQTFDKRLPGGVVLDYTNQFTLYKYSLFAQWAGRFADERLKLSLGFRTDGNGYNDYMRNPLNGFSPRTAFSYYLNERWTVDANWGIYKQLPPYTTLGYKDRDGVEANRDNESLNLVRARNNKEAALLALAQLIQLDDASGFDIVAPDFSKTEAKLPAFDANQVYTNALQWQPGILSAERTVSSADYLLKAARGQYLPTLSAFGGIGTGYSELSRKVTGVETQQQNIGSIDGVPILLDVNVPTYALTPFNEQLDQNFNRTFGFSLNVPLFNNLRTRSQVNLQKIAVDNARIQSDIQKNQLRRDIQTAWQNAKAAYERLSATTKALSATEKAFEYTTTRYDEGLLNIYDFTAGRNQLVAAQSNQAQARFELILRLKVLDFYLGKPIAF